MENNAGKVEKYTEVVPFFYSNYFSSQYRISTVTRIFLGIADILYSIVLTVMTIRVAFNLYNMIKTYIVANIIKFGSKEISDISDIILTTLSFVCYVYRIIVVLAQDTIALPLSGESDFDKHANFALLTEEYSFITSLASMMVCVRVVRILMIQFPDFGSLFYTFHYGRGDLCNIATSMIVIGLGFITTA